MANNIQDILAKNSYAIDARNSSVHSQEYLDFALQNRLSPLVICSNDNQGYWQELVIPDMGSVIKHSKLVGLKNNCDTCNGYLRRTKENNGKKSKTEYQATERYQDLVGQGILLIIDHNLNGTKQHHNTLTALSALTSVIMNSNSISKFIIINSDFLTSPSNLSILGYDPIAIDEHLIEIHRIILNSFVRANKGLKMYEQTCTLQNIICTNSRDNIVQYDRRLQNCADNREFDLDDFFDTVFNLERMIINNASLFAHIKLKDNKKVALIFQDIDNANLTNILMICNDPVLVTSQSPANITENSLLVLYAHDLPQQLLVTEPWTLIMFGLCPRKLLWNIISIFYHENTQSEIKVDILYHNMFELSMHQKIETKIGDDNILPLPYTYDIISK